MQRGQTSGPPIRITGRGGGDPGGEPSDSSEDLGAGDIFPHDRTGREPHCPHHRRRASQSIGGSEFSEGEPAAYFEQVHDTLEQDYARHSASTMPQQLAGPIMIPAPVQGPPMIQAVLQA